MYNINIPSLPPLLVLEIIQSLQSNDHLQWNTTFDHGKNAILIDLHNCLRAEVTLQSLHVKDRENEGH